ncbi:MAG: hypothetical protein AB1466_07195 [Actinomycetota bacterium]
MPYYERWIKPSKPSIGRNLLILFVFLSLIKGLLFAAIIPAWQGPDEPFQFGYVQYLVERKAFSIMGKAFLPPSIGFCYLFSLVELVALVLRSKI